MLFVVVPQLLTLLGCKPKTMYGNNPEAGHYYNVNGIKMYVEEYGSGKPLLMIHGNGGDMSSFTDNVPYFAKKYRVILVDGRAHGKTIDPRDSLTFEQMADDFAALLDTMHVPKAYVLGWSDGGINALLMAMRHPDKVIKLASTGANIWPGTTAIDPKGWEESVKYYNANKNRVWQTPVLKNKWKVFMLDQFQPNIKLTELQQIKCPAFIIAGEHDVIVDSHTRLIQKNIPNSELWIVKGSGHATLMEKADEFNKRVDEFFEK
ncbi:alpha/beta hydrolase [Mucilaginibacter pedocola]|uniref:Alpha/beta hydrolase n=2 Tax=Mucilaginibacter pedocola TaxID=1792845 RepID=A0A1S9PE81_9SPHI|nr:alpha/beta hydrolase [Mucilaginibacter pedocola]